MIIYHTTVRLRRGSLIRILGYTHHYFLRKERKDPISQYEVDMLWPDNKWERILVSKLYENGEWPMLKDIAAYTYKSKHNFNVTYLVFRAREKYGSELRV